MSGVGVAWIGACVVRQARSCGVCPVLTGGNVVGVGPVGIDGIGFGSAISNGISSELAGGDGVSVEVVEDNGVSSELAVSLSLIHI